MSATNPCDQGYYPYGETRYSTSSLYTDRLFTGQQPLAGLGLAPGDCSLGWADFAQKRQKTAHKPPKPAKTIPPCRTEKRLLQAPACTKRPLNPQILHETRFFSNLFSLFSALSPFIPR